MTDTASILLAWEANELNSWNPILADLLRDAGDTVTEVHDVDELERLDLEEFDVCLPRFRVGAAHMACLDERLVELGPPDAQLARRETAL